MSKTEEVRAGKPRRTSVVTSRQVWMVRWRRAALCPRLPHTLVA